LGVEKRHNPNRGWAIVRYRLLSIKKPESGSAVDIAREWQKLALFMRVPITSNRRGRPGGFDSSRM